MIIRINQKDNNVAEGRAHTPSHLSIEPRLALTPMMTAILVASQALLS